MNFCRQRSRNAVSPVDGSLFLHDQRCGRRSLRTLRCGQSLFVGTVDRNAGNVQHDLPAHVLLRSAAGFPVHVQLVQEGGPPHPADQFPQRASQTRLGSRVQRTLLQCGQTQHQCPICQRQFTTQSIIFFKIISIVIEF